MIIACLLGVTLAYMRKAPAAHMKRHYGNQVTADPTYTANTITVPLDWGNYTDTSETFTVRYLYDLQYVNVSANNTPILFYTGNEAPIDQFWDVSGFVTTTLAQQFSAAVVFVEHRYYGESIPRAATDATWAWSPEGSYGLTVENTLRDFEAVVDLFKNGTGPGTYDGPVIAFGGSYGGMLSAWMRMKYPSKIYAALASSAPVRWFKGVIDPNDYNTLSASVIENQIDGENCSAILDKGFHDMRNLQMDTTYYPTIQTLFNVCPTNDTFTFDNSTIFGELIDMVFDTVQSAPQTNYPEASASSPADKVQVMCDAAVAANVTTVTPNNLGDPAQFDMSYINALAAGFNIVNNFTNDTTTCNDFVADMDTYAWNLQICSQLPMPITGITDFYQAEWTANCIEQFGLTPQYEYALDVWGGRDPTLDYYGASNIIWSNGLNDPWSMGGLLSDVSPEMKVYTIHGAAHHADLRLPNADTDTAAVKDARKYETSIIAAWIKDWTNGYIGVVY